MKNLHSGLIPRSLALLDGDKSSSSVQIKKVRVMYRRCGGAVSVDSGGSAGGGPRLRSIRGAEW